MTGFEVIQSDKNCGARRGLLTTAHGQVATPAFMPVGTAGAVKGITPQQLKACGVEIMLSNTYHLILRPGIDTVEKLGGLHKFMAWDRPILTDSGGYQVFSLSPLAQITDDGVEFASHIDGAKLNLTAENATSVQNRLGADIIMCFDQCAPFPCDDITLQKAVERTLRWAAECKKKHSRKDQMLFGIVQGGINLSLREHCAREIVKINFDGYALGGLSVGEGHENMIKTLEYTIPFLPEDKPRYLMGVGTPLNIIAAVRAGIDMLDCVLPTRNGRNAFAFTGNGPLRLRNNVHINDPAPIEKGCDCYCCKNFSRAALRHFFNVGEMLGPVLVSIHNLRFYQKLMAQIRQSIENAQFNKWAAEISEKYRCLELLKNAQNSAISL